MTYYFVRRKGKPCGHRHTSEAELALCWRKRGELWMRDQESIDPTARPVTEATQLARIRALVPRPVMGRPRKEKPAGGPLKRLHVKGISAADLARYTDVYVARGYSSMSDYVRALLECDATAHFSEGTGVDAAENSGG